MCENKPMNNTPISNIIGIICVKTLAYCINTERKEGSDWSMKTSSLINLSFFPLSVHAMCKYFLLIALYSINPYSFHQQNGKRKLHLDLYYNSFLRFEVFPPKHLGEAWTENISERKKIVCAPYSL